MGGKGGQSATSTTESSQFSHFLNESVLDQLTSTLQRQESLGQQTAAQEQIMGVDERSQAFIEEMRARALERSDILAQAPVLTPERILELTGMFQDPAKQQILKAGTQEFDIAEAMAKRNVAQQATAANAFGGSRAAVERAVRIGEIDRARAGFAADVESQTFRDALGTAMSVAMQEVQDPLQRAIAQTQALQGALGPTGEFQLGTQDSQTAQINEAAILALMNQLGIQEGVGRQFGHEQTETKTSGGGNILGDIIGIASVLGGLF